MKEVFGAGLCRLLIINSRNPERGVEEPLPDIWTRCMPRYDLYRHNVQNQIEQQLLLQQQQLGTDNSTQSDFAQLIQPPSLQPTPIGHFLSKQDLQYIANMVEEMIVNGVVPHMERKIRSINQTAGANKRGLGNKIKTMFTFKRGTGDTPTASPLSGDGITVGGNRFVYSTPEIQLRRMADYCFMLHDYEVALTTYRLISADFKNNKQDWKFYAGTQVCLYFINSNKKGIYWIMCFIQQR
jgi:hypothetical protein